MARHIRALVVGASVWPLSSSKSLTMTVPAGFPESGLAYTLVRSWGGAYLAYLPRNNTRRHTGAKACSRCSLRLFAIGARFRRSRCGVGVVASHFRRSRCGVGVVAE